MSTKQSKKSYNALNDTRMPEKIKDDYLYVLMSKMYSGVIWCYLDPFNDTNRIDTYNCG